MRVIPLRCRVLMKIERFVPRFKFHYLSRIKSLEKLVCNRTRYGQRGASLIVRTRREPRYHFNINTRSANNNDRSYRRSFVNRLVIRRIGKSPGYLVARISRENTSCAIEPVYHFNYAYCKFPFYRRYRMCFSSRATPHAVSRDNSFFANSRRRAVR